MKSKEELLSEEIRAYADMALRMIQWGVTLMVSVQTAIFFARREILAGDIEAKKLPPGSELPVGRYLVGTLFLIFLAVVLSALTNRTLKQYRHYKDQLLESKNTEIKHLPVKHAGRWAYLLYFSFPAIDVAIRIALFKIGF